MQLAAKTCRSDRLFSKVAGPTEYLPVSGLRVGSNFEQYNFITIRESSRHKHNLDDVSNVYACECVCIL